MSVLGAVGGPVTALGTMNPRPRRRKTPVPGPVAAIVLLPATINAIADTAAGVSCELRDGASALIIDPRSIVWSTTDALVATVLVNPNNNRNATITMVGAGSCTIKATAEGIEGTCAVTVTVSTNQPPVVQHNGPYTTIEDQAVQFSAAGSFDAESGFTIAYNPGDGSGWTAEFPGSPLAAPAGYLYSHVYPTPGTYVLQVRGTDEDAGVTIVQTTVTVELAGQAAVATLDVSPSSFSLAEGGTQDMVAAPRDSNGVLLTGRSTNWESSNTNVCTLAVVPGQPYTVRATIVGEGSAIVTVTCEGIQDTVAVTGTAAGGGAANEPAGATMRRRHIGDSVTGTQLDGRIWTLQKIFPGSGNGITAQVDGSAPFSPSGVLRGQWGAGTEAGQEPFNYFHGTFGPLEEVYIRWYLKFNRHPTTGGWEDHGAGSKVLGFMGVGQADKNNQLYWQTGAAGSFGVNPIVTSFRLDFRQQNFINGSRNQNISSRRIQVGQYHLLEFRMKLNTYAGATTHTNGRYRYWLDNELLADHQNMAFINELNPLGFKAQQWAPTFGGDPRYPAKQWSDTADVDDIYISGIDQ